MMQRYRLLNTDRVGVLCFHGVETLNPGELPTPFYRFIGDDGQNDLEFIVTLLDVVPV
jgi:hypothetical protein